MTRDVDGSVLIEKAVAATDLEDFGDSCWRAGFDVLIDALSVEARLNSIGDHAFTLRIGAYLEQRLRIVDWQRRHPEIDRQSIEALVTITGLPRTGTTALSNLLAEDPATRSLRVWESAAPTPPPAAASSATDSRIAAAQRGIDMMNQLVPDLKAMHDDTATSTAEAIDLLGMSFRTHHFSGMAYLPSYDRWWFDCDMEPAYRFHRKVLQLLQWRCPPTRWHLKNPPDVFCLDALCRVYPDAFLLWTHRDPAEVLPSVCSLVATIREMASEQVDRRALGREMVDAWSTGIERALSFRRSHPEARFADVFMRDLVRDPLATVANIYEKVNWRFTAEAEGAMASWLAANPPGRHGAHRPDPADFGLSAESIREHFSDYITSFDIETSR